MTIKEFALKKNVLESTVRGWCEKKLIRGAKIDEKTDVDAQVTAQLETRLSSRCHKNTPSSN